MTKPTYFYADDDADLYDIAIYLTQPYYDLVHEISLNLVKEYANKKLDAESNILNLGPGTGKDIIGILKLIENVNIVAVDISDEMIQKSKEKISQEYPDIDFTNKIKWLSNDLTSEIVTAEYLLNQLNLNKTEGYDIVISAFVLHHLTFEEKRVLYKTIYDVLNPGGIFINIDLFGYSNSNLNALSDKLSKDFMIKQLSDPDDEFKYLHDQLSNSQRKEQLEKWIKHWDEENIHLALVDNQNTESKTESSLLLKSRFKSLEIVYRYLHTSIIASIKE